MKYAPPIGSADPNTGYVDRIGNIPGSPVPAAAIEPGMREIVNVISRAGLTPDNTDLTQLEQAIAKMVLDGSLKPGPEGSVLTSLNNTLSWQPSKIPFTLPDGPLHLYVRTDGNDANNGLANTNSGAFATLERACRWVREHIFYGGGYIQINVANGTYAGISGNFTCTTSFLDPLYTYDFARDLYQPQVLESSRVRIVGNYASPQSVVLNLYTDVPSASLANAKCYGVTFAINPQSLLRDSFLAVADAHVCNCRFVANAGAFTSGSSYALLRLRGTAKFTGPNAFILGSPVTLSCGFSSEGVLTQFGTHQVFPTGAAATITSQMSLTGATLTTYGFLACSYANYVQIMQGTFAPGSFSYSGTVGPRYTIAYPSFVSSGGYGASFFPGNTAGSAAIPSSGYV